MSIYTRSRRHFPDDGQRDVIRGGLERFSSFPYGSILIRDLPGRRKTIGITRSPVLTRVSLDLEKRKWWKSKKEGAKKKEKKRDEKRERERERATFPDNRSDNGTSLRS